ncbi:DUF305 domain-containing protein [Deinococcus aluminii]|uniref:DUF305 domain-containing protein n=1 Tax=Deinococcus aluminii TaxID=1656885 RepID=A0ABP9XF97_9DEIO
MRERSSGRGGAGRPLDWLEVLARHPGWLAVLGLVASALIAVASALAPRVLTPAENSAEVRFLREMIPHHAQAVDLAVRIRDRSDDPALRSLALKILLTQQEERGRMRGVLNDWGFASSAPAPEGTHAAMMGMATPAQVQQVSTLPVRDAERLFLRLMIRHHQGALMMARPVSGERVRPELRSLAHHVHAAQTDEIEMMTRMLAVRDAKPLPPPELAPMDGMDMGGSGGQ